MDTLDPIYSPKFSTRRCNSPTEADIEVEPKQEKEQYVDEQPPNNKEVEDVELKTIPLDLSPPTNLNVDHPDGTSAEPHTDKTPTTAKTRYEKRQNDILVQQTNNLVKLFKTKLNNKQITKNNVSVVVLSGLLSLVQLKNTTFEQKKKIVTGALNNYLLQCESINTEDKQDLLFAAEVALDSSSMLYGELNVKKCCTLV